MRNRILIVDDMKEVYDKIKCKFGKRYNLDWASSEEQALEKIKENDYGFVLTDYDLAGSSHNGGLRIIKAAKEKGLSAILMSREDHKDEALKVGADNFYFKKRIFEGRK